MDQNTLTWAIKGIDRELETLLQQQTTLQTQRNELQNQLDNANATTFNNTTKVAAVHKTQRRVVSEETRQKQAERMRERWAMRKRTNTPTNKPTK